MKYSMIGPNWLPEFDLSVRVDLSRFDLQALTFSLQESLVLLQRLLLPFFLGIDGERVVVHLMKAFRLWRKSKIDPIISLILLQDN